MIRNMIIVVTLILIGSLSACNLDISALKKDNKTDNQTDNKTDNKTDNGTINDNVTDNGTIKDNVTDNITVVIDPIERLRPLDNKTYGNPYNIVISGNSFAVADGSVFTDPSLSIKDQCSVNYSDLTEAKFISRDGMTTYITNRRQLIRFHALFYIADKLIGTTGKGKTVVIVRDIDMCNDATFRSIGDVPGTAGKILAVWATFDGNNKVISNLVLNVSNVNLCAGFICGLSSDNGGRGVLKNIGIKGKIDMTGKAINNVGGAVGQSWGGSIYNVFTDIEVIAPSSDKVGGVVGYVRGGDDYGYILLSEIKNVKSFGKVTGKNGVGGIVGETSEETPSGAANNGPTLESVSNYGSINGSLNFGGIIGNFTTKIAPAKCINKGSPSWMVGSNAVLTCLP